MSKEISSQKKIDISAKKIVAGWPKVGYDGKNNKIQEFYSKTSGQTKSRTSLFSHKKLADIFIFAMTLGKHEGIKKPYSKKSDRKDSIDMEYIASQPEYIWMMIAVAIDESNGDLEIFQDPKTKIIDVCEEYANYGIELLMNMESKASVSDPYFGYEEEFDKLLKDLDN